MPIRKKVAKKCTELDTLLSKTDLMPLKSKHSPRIGKIVTRDKLEEKLVIGLLLRWGAKSFFKGEGRGRLGRGRIREDFIDKKFAIKSLKNLKIFRALLASKSRFFIEFFGQGRIFQKAREPPFF